jgi:hypothetical protein
LKPQSNHKSRASIHACSAPSTLRISASSSWSDQRRPGVGRKRRCGVKPKTPHPLLHTSKLIFGVYSRRYNIMLTTNDFQEPSVRHLLQADRGRKSSRLWIDSISFRGSYGVRAARCWTTGIMDQPRSADASGCRGRRIPAPPSHRNPWPSPDQKPRSNYARTPRSGLGRTGAPSAWRHQTPVGRH